MSTKMISEYVENDVMDCNASGAYVLAVKTSGRYRSFKVGQTVRPIIQRCYEIRMATQKNYRIMNLIETPNEHDSEYFEAKIRRTLINEYGAKCRRNKKDYMYIESTVENFKHIINTVIAQIIEEEF